MTLYSAMVEVDEPGAERHGHDGVRELQPGGPGAPATGMWSLSSPSPTTNQTRRR